MAVAVSPSLAPSVALVDARAALAEVAPRLAALIRSIRNPAAPAVGEWNAGDVAVHLTHVWDVLPSLARGEGGSPIRSIEELPGLTTALVRAEPERDLDHLAARIEAGAAAYLASSAPDNDDVRPWLIEGTALPPASFACHLLNESLVHGFDIAHAERRPWRIDPRHAGMALMGFTFPALSLVDGSRLVDPVHGAGVRACFDLRARGAGRVFLVLDDGVASIEAPSDRRVDCHISAAPDWLFLVVWSRVSQWRGALTGRSFVWGRRPLLGARLPRMLRNP